MIEESPEGFIQRWREYAADVQLFPRTEGSPLLECLAAGAILQLLDRTGPYLAGSGRQRVILNPMVERLSPNPDQLTSLEVSGLGALKAAGRVIAGEGRMSVVDCGVPLVVAVVGEDGERFDAGGYVQFEVLPPVHGFVIRDETRSKRRDAAENTDEAM
ncbi:MAG: hypothetical protein P8Z81_02915 [Deinococcales bacterium]